MNFSDLKAWKLNPRDIDEAAVEALQKSIERFGDLSGIVFNRRNEALVCGHQRIARIHAIAHNRGETATVDLSNSDVGYVRVGEDSFALRIVDWDDATHAAACVAANSDMLQGTFDVVKAVDLIATLNDDMLLHELRLDDLADQMKIDAGFDLDQMNATASVVDQPDEVPAMELQPYEHYDYVIVLARRTHEFNRLVELLGLQRVHKPESTKSIGLGRAVSAEKLLRLIDEKQPNQPAATALAPPLVSNSGAQSQTRGEYGPHPKIGPNSDGIG